MKHFTEFTIDALKNQLVLAHPGPPTNYSSVVYQDFKFAYCMIFNILASDGCLQYFTGVSGQMWSFNYNDASGLQLSNTDYSICVRMERNFCGIQYTACPDAGNNSSLLVLSSFTSTLLFQPSRLWQRSDVCLLYFIVLTRSQFQEPHQTVATARISCRIRDSEYLIDCQLVNCKKIVLYI